jgi:hypothetical protein
MFALFGCLLFLLSFLGISMATAKSISLSKHKVHVAGYGSVDCFAQFKPASCITQSHCPVWRSLDKTLNCEP